jgi:hypothetical protein
MRNAHKILIGKCNMNIPLCRPRNRWEENITLDLREIWWEDVDWMHMIQNMYQWQAVVNTVMNLQVP